MLFIVATLGAHAADWRTLTTNSTASLRGLAVVDSRVAWASGTRGTVLRTSDSGKHWKASLVPNSAALDFRDIEAPDSTRAWLLASGPGDKSRVYFTRDAGANWQFQLTNPDPTGFFDAIAFFNKRSGILLGDPVDNRFVIFTTTDGLNWQRRPGPEALPGEGAFAASGTCLIARANGEAWFGTGAARIFHTRDSGATWTVTQTPSHNRNKHQRLHRY